MCLLFSVEREWKIKEVSRVGREGECGKGV